MRRQRSLEPAGIESVTIDVKEFGNNWFIICACYPSPGKCKSADFISACVCTAEKMYNKQKEIMFIGDFNMNMLEGKDNQHGPNQELSSFCDQLCLSNMICSPTRVTQSSVRCHIDIPP